MEGRPERAHLQAGPRSHKPPSRLPSPTPFVFLRSTTEAIYSLYCSLQPPPPPHPFNTEWDRMLGPCSSWSMLKKSLTFCLRGDSPSAKRGSPRAAVPWLLAKGGRAKSFLLVHTGGAVRTQPSPTWIPWALVLGHFFFLSVSLSQLVKFSNLSVLFIFFLRCPSAPDSLASKRLQLLR